MIKEVVENASNNEMNFASGALNIQSGRALTKEDRNKVLIHEELAKENNVKLGIITNGPSEHQWAKIKVHTRIKFHTSQ